MLWIIPTWLGSLLVAAICGYKLRDLVKKVEHLQEVVKSKVDKQPEPEEPKSQLIDPLDPVQNAIYERNKMMEKLNGRPT